MNAQTMILGFLMRSSMTGYEIKKRFSFSFAFFSGLSYGSIYPALKNMEQKGLITMKLEIQDGAPNRKVYTITDQGKNGFLKELKTPADLGRLKSEYLPKLFFFADLEPRERRDIAARHLEVIHQAHTELEAARPEIERNADHFQKLCFEFGLRFFEDFAANVAKTIKDMEP